MAEVVFKEMLFEIIVSHLASEIEKRRQTTYPPCWIEPCWIEQYNGLDLHELAKKSNENLLKKTPDDIVKIREMEKRTKARRDAQIYLPAVFYNVFLNKEKEAVGITKDFLQRVSEYSCFAETDVERRGDIYIRDVNILTLLNEHNFYEAVIKELDKYNN